MMPRTSVGRMIRAGGAARGLTSVATRILNAGDGTIENRAEASPRMAQENAKAQAAVAVRAEFKPWAIRFLLTARGRHRIPDAKSWSDGINELSEPELEELAQRLGISYEPPKLPQSYPKPTPKLPQTYPTMTPE